MNDAWPALLGQFKKVLEKPRRQWSAEETSEVWSALVRGQVGLTLFKTAYRRLGDRDVAEEVLQNCLAQLSIDTTYDPEDKGAEAFRTWVNACLHHHLCAHYGRVRRDSAKLPEDIGALDLPDRSDQFEAVGAAVDIGRMLNTLDPDKRSVLSLRLVGMKAVEIAQALDMDETNVRQLSFRAIRQLRKNFGVVFRNEFSRLES